jgi:hypothetical protein
MSNDDDDDESSDEMAGSEIEDDRNQRRLMAERNARIMQKKLRRRGALCSEEDDDDESVILTQSKNNPYRKLAMQEQFTPPREKLKTVVSETDEDCEAECNDPEEQSEEEELMTQRLAVDTLIHSGNMLNHGVRTRIKRQKSIGISMRLWSSH